MVFLLFPALASSLSKIPIIGSVFGDSDLIGLKQAQEKGLTSQDRGNDKRIMVFLLLWMKCCMIKIILRLDYIIESEKELDDEYFGAGMDFTIDGKAPYGSSGSYGEEVSILQFSNGY